MHLETPIGRIPYEADFGGDDKVLSMKDYIAHMDEAYEENSTEPEYIFNSKLLNMPEFAHLARAVPMPPPFMKVSDPLLQQVMKQKILEQETATQFFLGPAYSGAPFHFHEDAWNALAFGKKRWFMLPPHHGLYSTEPPYSFYHNKLDDYESSHKVMQCVQNAGDVIYVPNMWSHMILNLKESIGLAVEFKAGYWQ